MKKEKRSGDATLRRRGVRIFERAAGWFVEYQPSTSSLTWLFDEFENRPLGPFPSALDANNSARLMFGLKQRAKIKTPAQRKKELAHYERVLKKLFVNEQKEKTKMLYRRPLPRDHLEALVEHLAATYPKTFFTEKSLKRPLKKNILADLEKDRVLDDEQREAAVSFYTKDWNYEWTLLAGAKRINLSGEEVGVVTELEAREAQNRVRAQKEEHRRALASRHSPAEHARSLLADGKIPTDLLSKINAVPLPMPISQPQPFISTSSPPADPVAARPSNGVVRIPTPLPTPQPQPLPTPSMPAQPNGIDLARLRDLWGSVDAIYTNTSDEALRRALAAAALKVLVAEATNTIASLEDQYTSDQVYTHN